jgi:hypothetical protein
MVGDPDSVHQLILISSQGDIMCLQVHDPYFFVKGAFPSEGSKVLCDGVIFDQLMGLSLESHHQIIQSEEFDQIQAVDLNELGYKFLYYTCTTCNNTSIEPLHAGKSQVKFAKELE